MEHFNRGLFRPLFSVLLVLCLLVVMPAEPSLLTF